MTGSRDSLDRRTFLKRLARGAAAGAGLAVLPRSLWASVNAPVTETARCWRAMGTLLEVRIPDLPEADAVEAIRAVRRRMEELEAAMTLFRRESPLVAMNTAPEGTWLNLPRDLVRSLETARELHRRFPGCDPTVAPMVRAWGLHCLERGRRPDPATRKRFASRTGPQGWEVDADRGAARRLDARVEFDLGATGKGFAMDEVVPLLRAQGSNAALLNFGGMVTVLGAPVSNPDGWPVVVADAEPVVHVASGTLAVSASEERRVSPSVHHILDPETGAPALGTRTASRAQTAAEADARSTHGFVTGARAELFRKATRTGDLPTDTRIQ